MCAKRETKNTAAKKSLENWLTSYQQLFSFYSKHLRFYVSYLAQMLKVKHLIVIRIIKLLVISCLAIMLNVNVINIAS